MSIEQIQEEERQLQKAIEMSKLDVTDSGIDTEIHLRPTEFADERGGGGTNRPNSDTFKEVQDTGQQVKAGLILG